MFMGNVAAPLPRGVWYLKKKKMNAFFYKNTFYKINEPRFLALNKNILRTTRASATTNKLRTDLPTQNIQIVFSNHKQPKTTLEINMTCHAGLLKMPVCLLRPKKNMCLFPVTCPIQKLGSVGRLFCFFVVFVCFCC